MNQIVAIKSFRSELDRMSGEIGRALPSHIRPEKFQRVLITAIQNNPDLLYCDRQSLWNSAMRAAQDGLLADNREGAIISFKDKTGKKIAQWLPMIQGLRKKARNSGEIATWECHAVYEQDKFSFALGDKPYIEHSPSLAAERGPLIAVYSVAVLKSGEISRDVMSVHDVNRIRARSRAKGGPWETDFEEMAKKTVARRHSKALPMSSDLDELIRRDDSLYEIGEPPPRPRLADYSDDDGEPDKPGGMDFPTAYDLGVQARDAGKPPAPPADLAAEWHDAFVEGWNSRNDELPDETKTESRL